MANDDLDEKVARAVEDWLNAPEGFSIRAERMPDDARPWLHEVRSMARREFTTKTRKEALRRSGKRCEASGSWYGLPEGQRCTADLSLGVEYDHYILDANSKDNSLENCRAVCPKCHGWKTRHRDTPTAAKTVRQQFMGMKTKPKKPVQSRSFDKPAKPKREAKPMPARRSLYAPASEARG